MSGADPALVNHARSGHGPSGFDPGEDLRALADRCEAAEAKDRNLDTEILWHCDRARFQRGYWNAASGMPRPLERMPSPNSGLGYIGAQCSAPVYTASLDAAMVLIPEGCGAEIGSSYGDDVAENSQTFALTGKWRARVYTPNDGSFEVEAATAPLALCAAALRARASRIVKGLGL